MRARAIAPVLVLAAVTVAFGATAATVTPEQWRAEWPETDFARRAVDLDEIISGGLPRDGIPAIDDPRFVPVGAVEDLADTEPVIGLVLDGDAHAYPLRILIWHEIVNDVVGGVPVAVTYCPLCNAAIAFDRRVDGRILEFGTTGKLRKSDLVMYDRQTESWWQQFTGTAIVGELTGARLESLPARLESFARFKERAPAGRVLVPGDPDLRPYGTNPYARYDSAPAPFLYIGELPTEVPAMMRVVAVADEAWTLELLRREGRIETDGLVLAWTEGQSSALDTPRIAEGRDVGNVVVQRRTETGLEDIPYGVTFAFVFQAFEPDGVLHTLDGAARQDD